MRPRLERQLEFIREIDGLKHILRQTYLMDASRQENDAEHSWHIALMALVLAEHANEPVDVLRVIAMLLIHDLVEIDAGDTFLYSDERARQAHRAAEERAADRIFGLLPAEQARRFRELWEEFEAKASPEACYAAALDRLQPLLHNFATEGLAWRNHGVRREQVVALNSAIAKGSQGLWDYAQRLIDEAVARGYLAG
ncbi:MAG: 5'-nucleotidase [Deltaproteobacteria bacterium ADurb.Bin510]|nr:MAG: 5'-nucleotidase [Deltaproteobacteria bacterium ADurb.Bin510]